MFQHFWFLSTNFILILSKILSKIRNGKWNECRFIKIWVFPNSWWTFPVYFAFGCHLLRSFAGDPDPGPLVLLKAQLAFSSGWLRNYSSRSLSRALGFYQEPFQARFWQGRFQARFIWCISLLMRICICFREYRFEVLWFFW